VHSSSRTQYTQLSDASPKFSLSILAMPALPPYSTSSSHASCLPVANHRSKHSFSCSGGVL
jgi:hypothetical protein